MPLKPVLYYQSTANYPAQLLACIGSLKSYFAGLLYKEETLENALKRFFISNIETSSDVGIDDAIQIFKGQRVFPFTAYNVGEQELLMDRKSFYAGSGLYFSNMFNCSLDSKPVRQEIYMISFFSNPYDYEVAMKLLQSKRDNVIKLNVPITINSVITTFPVLMKYELVKGQYAFQFEEYLRINDIYDISHIVSLFYQDITSNTTSIYPVEEMYFNLYKQDLEDDSLNILLQRNSAPSTPELISSSPADDEEDVDITNSIILTFNVSMIEQTVENAITIEPFISANYSWNESSTQLLINPVSNLLNETIYTITIDTTAKAFVNEEPLESEVIITFTTEDA